MNKFYFLSFFLIAFISCKSEKEKRIQAVIEAENKLEELIDEQQKSNNLTNLLLLDYRFGMTKEEVDAHTNILLQQKKISLDKSGDVNYVFKLNSSELPLANSFFSFDFYKNKLCQLYITIATPENPHEADENFILDKFKTYYIKEYTEANTVVIPNSTKPNEGIAFVRNNLLIEIGSDFGNTTIVYKDVPKIKLKDAETPINVSSVQSSSETFLNEVKENMYIMDATITDQNFLYIAVQDDGQSKEGMATYYCRFAASKGMQIEAVKIVDAATFKKYDGAATGHELAKSFCK